MLAIAYDRFGPPEVMRIAEFPRPECLGTEVLVRVRAAGVNPIDWKVRRGEGVFGQEDLPIIPGWEISGVVEAVAPGVTRFQPGDKVYGMPRFPRLAAAYAEFVTARARQLAPKPVAVDDIHAAGLPVAALTAWQALVDTANVRAGQRVLIRGAAGGVGHLAIQIARARGAEVVGTAREELWGFLEHLGASGCVDDRRVDIGVAMANSFDVALDVVGGEGAVASLDTVRRGGTLIVLNWPRGVDMIGLAAKKQVRATGLLVEPDYAALEQVSRLVDDGLIGVHIERSFPLNRAADAHQLGEAGGHRGKLVLEIS